MTLLIGLTNKLDDAISYVDTLDFGNPTQLVFHYVFSFGIFFCGGSYACISCIILTKDYYSLYSSSQSIANFLLIGSLSLNTYSSITLLMVMAIFTSILWIERFETSGSTTTSLSVGFIFLFLNIFYISLYLGHFMILCLVSPQI